MLQKFRSKMLSKRTPATTANVATFLSELKDMKTPEAFSAHLRARKFKPTKSLGRLDPSSEEYAKIVMEQYLEIRGKNAYDPAIDEKDNVLDLSTGNNHVVYPFTTCDPILAGSYLVGVGIALRAMQLPPGSTIVEYGIGWGHTTMALAQLGYKVTAIDIEQKFLDLVKIRSNHVGLTIDVHHGEFGQLPSNIDSVDGILFFECFHHCLNHIKVLAELVPRLRSGGRIVFAGEPLFNSWYYPWGLRMDGQSIWAIATHGWMELGFKRRYLETLLTSHGLRLEHHYHKEFGCVGEVYVGIKK